MFSENLARFQPFYDVDVGWGYLFVTALSIAALLHLFSQLLSVPVKRSPASTLQETSITKYAMENAANGTISHKSGKLPLRIAILECDTPLDKTRAKYRGYGGVFKQMLERSADALKYPGLSSKQGMEISSFNIEHYPALYPNLNDFDAVLLTGSRTQRCLSVTHFTLTFGFRIRCILFRPMGRSAGGIYQRSSQSKSCASYRRMLWTSDRR